MQKIIFLTAAIFLINLKELIYGYPYDESIGNDRELQFIILHNNDIHARFEQTSQNSGKCLKADADAGHCYGGFARLAHEIRKYRQKAKDGGTPVLFLNAGDTYTGTTWFTLFKHTITAEFLNILAPDAVSLGNHEFDEGVNGLILFLKNVQFPVLTTNMDLSKTPELAAMKMLSNSIVLSVLGVRVGIIGYLTPETKHVAIPSDVEYYEEVAAINKEAEILTKKGINIIIALGHSGFQKDQEIAQKCPEIDIVIGGHTNTFLYNGKQPDYETIDDFYPKVITQLSGKKVPVVQAYAFTKYLGKLHVTFDKAGNLIKWDGLPIILNAGIPEDQDVLTLLERYRPNITALENNLVGLTRVPLDGLNCRKEECNLGNFIADSMVFGRALEVENLTEYWTDTAIAFVQGGGIRASISKRPDGAITMNDLLTVLPWQNSLYKVTITGLSIRNALERSAAVWETDSNGGFLQLSGLQVTYDMSLPIGQRVQNVFVLCAECLVPNYSTLNNNEHYNIIASEFILAGGDGFNLTESAFPFKHAKVLFKNDIDILTQFIASRSPIYPGIDWRIKIFSDSTKCCDSSTTVVSSLIVLLLSYAVNYF